MGALVGGDTQIALHHHFVHDSPFSFVGALCPLNQLQPKPPLVIPRQFLSEPEPARQRSPVGAGVAHTALHQNCVQRSPFPFVGALWARKNSQLIEPPAALHAHFEGEPPLHGSAASAPRRRRRSGSTSSASSRSVCIMVVATVQLRDITGGAERGE